ncbi:MAG: VOC family protein [Actinomycetota bacterium]|nr:VOC family protein [Actinomycetota bacterium]
MTTGGARVEWLCVGGSAGPWERLGLVVVVDGLAPLFGTGIRFAEHAESGIDGWALSGVERQVTDVDGLPTEVVEPAPPVLVSHPLGAYELDHVVVTTGSLERTCAAITDVTGAPLQRVRELGAMRQGFHRLCGLVVEVVARAELGDEPASFWGLVLNVDDLDAAVARLGPDVVGPAKPAVQPGRSIATVREAAGLGLPVALMSPP